ncbi:MAG: efflux RND transporter periplasmic adaptor subunit [Bacteroidia bacterium]
MKIKTVILLLFAIAAGTGLYFFFSKSKAKNIVWRTAKIEKGKIGINVTSTGSINAVTTVSVGTQVTGTIAKLFADFNSVVKKGQIIAILDTTFLVAARDEAAALADKAKIQLTESKREFDRMQKLYDQKVNPQADYDLALTNYESAKSSLASAIASLNRAKINLQYATIRAPISGTVISRNVDVGQTVVSSFNSPVLYTIANDLTKMQVQANVDEADIGEIKVGQKATFSVDAFPNDLFEGLVKQIRLQPITVQNVVNYVVIIDVHNPELKLLPGLTANITVKIEEHPNVLKIPLNALHFTPSAEYFTRSKIVPDSVKKQWDDFAKQNAVRPEKENAAENKQPSYIWLQKNNFLLPVHVSIGISDGTFIEVSGNIKEGDDVVLGVSHGETTAAPTVQNPFMPKMPGRKN